MIAGPIDREWNENFLHQASSLILRVWDLVSRGLDKYRDRMTQHPTYDHKRDPMKEYKRRGSMREIMETDHQKAIYLGERSQVETLFSIIVYPSSFSPLTTRTFVLLYGRASLVPRFIMIPPF